MLSRGNQIQREVDAEQSTSIKRGVALRDGGMATMRIAAIIMTGALAVSTSAIAQDPAASNAEHRPSASAGTGVESGVCRRTCAFARKESAAGIVHPHPAPRPVICSCVYYAGPKCPIGETDWFSNFARCQSSVVTRNGIRVLSQPRRGGIP